MRSLSTPLGLPNRLGRCCVRFARCFESGRLGLLLRRLRIPTRPTHTPINGLAHTRLPCLAHTHHLMLKRVTRGLLTNTSRRTRLRSTSSGGFSRNSSAS